MTCMAMYSVANQLLCILLVRCLHALSLISSETCIDHYLLSLIASSHRCKHAEKGTLMEYYFTLLSFFLLCLFVSNWPFLNLDQISMGQHRHYSPTLQHD